MGVLEDVLLPPEPGPGDKFLWGTVTSMGPLRVQLDGETAPIPITPELCCDVWVGARVWCQLNNRQLIVLTVATGTLLSDTKEIRRVGVDKVTSNQPSTYTTADYNIATVTLPQSLTVTGFKFNIRGYTNIVPDTAGAYTDLVIRIGQNASVGGTTIGSGYVDHRIAGRIVSLAIDVPEYVYAETTDVADMNIVLCGLPSAGSYCYGSSVRPAWLAVDWILP